MIGRPRRAAARIEYSIAPTYVHVRVPMSCRSTTSTSRSLSVLSGGPIVPFEYSEWMKSPLRASTPLARFSRSSVPRMPCSGREESDELHPRRARLGAAQPIDVRLAALVDARLIGDQSDASSANQMNAVREQDADPGPHPRRRGLARPPRRARARREQQQHPPRDARRASRVCSPSPSLHARCSPVVTSRASRAPRSSIMARCAAARRSAAFGPRVAPARAPIPRPLRP